MFSSLVWGAAFAMLTLNACTNEVTQSLPEDQPDGDIKEVVFIAAGFDEDNGVQSRVDYTIGKDENEVKKAFFSWAVGDTIGILPKDAAQVYFKIAEIDETDPTKAKFTGVAWGLKSEVDYAAYYPFIGDIFLKRTEVPVDYSVQRYSHAVNNEGQLVVSPSHNYQAAKPVQREDGGLNFEFKHLGGLVEVQFALPEGESGAIKQLHLVADEPVFPVKGTFNLEAEPVAITPDEAKLASSVTVNVSNLTAEAGSPVSVFFMMPPMASVDISKLSVSVVYGEKNTMLPFVVTEFTNRQGVRQTSLQAATYYTMTTEAMEVPEALVVESLPLSGNIDAAMDNLGGTKLRFVTGSPMESETVVYTDEYETKAYALRNGDWLEVHTLARFIKLSGSVHNMFDANHFSNFAKLISLALSDFDTSEVTDMSYMFYGCSGLTSLNLSGFKTSKVTRMNSMFEGCSGLTSLDLSGFDTSNVTNMSSMFYGCLGLTSLNLSGFKTSKVTSMSSMFYGCSRLISLALSDFDTSEVTSMSSMFYGCSRLISLALSDFDTSEVTDMSYMFYGCSGLTSLNLSGFKTSKVTRMNSMFEGCSGLTSLALSGFDTSNVTDMSSMFYGCSGLTSLNLSGFDTSGVTNMSYMFYGCSGLTSLDLSGFTFKDGVGVDNIFLNIANDVTEGPININVTSAGKTYLENQMTGIDEDYAKLHIIIGV